MDTYEENLRRVITDEHGVNLLLRSIDDVVDGSTHFLAQDCKDVSGEEMQGMMTAVLKNHAEAFDRGLIPCQRLIDVALPPFLKLARKASQEPTSETPADAASARLRDSMLIGLGGALELILGEACPPKDARSMVVPCLLSLRKRAELIKALLMNKFPEDLVGLLAGSSPRASMRAMLILQEICMLPSESVTTYDRVICRSLLGNRAVVNPLAKFAILNAVEAPVTDTEWVGREVMRVFVTIMKPGCLKIALTRLPGPANGRVMVLLDDEGVPNITVSNDLFEKSQQLSASMHASMGGVPGWDEAIDRIAGVPVGYTRRANQPQERVPVQFSSARAHLQTCSNCGKSGVSAKLSICTRCRKVWYCSKECQLAHWKAGHKKDCVMKD